MKRILALILLPALALADGTWTKTALSHQAPYPAALVGRPANLARFAQTALTVDGNTRTGWQDPAWKSSMTLVTNGVFDTNVSGNDEGLLYPMQTGSSAAFAFGAPARVDEVRVYSCWRDNGRCDVGVASVDVCDAQGNWTSLPGSELAFSDGGASVGWCLVFADASGDRATTHPSLFESTTTGRRAQSGRKTFSHDAKKLSQSTSPIIFVRMISPNTFVHAAVPRATSISDCILITKKRTVNRN